MLANVFDITSCFRLSLPCGGRRDVFASRLNVWRFQSTPSVGRATAKIYKYTILRLYIVHIKLYIFATAVLFT